MSRLWKALGMLVTAASLASCGGGGGGGILGGGCSDEDIGAVFLYGHGLDGTVGVALRAEPNITGVPVDCRAELRFSLDDGALPPGVALNERTGVISGIPTQGGRYPFTIRLTLKNFEGGVNAYLSSVIRDPAEATFTAWEVATDTQEFDHAMRIGAIGNELYVVGRSSYRPRLFTYKSVDGGRTWTRLDTRADMFVELYALASAGNHIYLSGGVHGRDASSAVWRFDGTTWTLMTARGAFPPRAGHTMLGHRGALYILGGYGADGRSLGDVWRSTDDGATWTQLNAGFPSRYNFCALGDGKGSLYVVGGRESRTRSRFDMWQSTDDGATWQEVPVSGTSPVVEVLDDGQATCSLLNGRMVVVGQSITVSSGNGRDWVLEPHHLWLSATPGAVTVDGRMYVLSGEGNSSAQVFRTTR